MAKYRLRHLALSLALPACLAAAGCRRPDTEGHQRAAAKTTLFKVCKLVYLGQSFTAEATPTTLPALIAWLEEHVSKDEAFIDYRNRTIKDAWGGEIVVIARNGTFVGVGSPGPNGTWEDGSGDDLVVTLEEVKRRGGSPKASLPTGRQPGLLFLEDLGKRLAIRVEADSCDALARKVKPTLAWTGPDLKGPPVVQWGRPDMMWVGKDEKGNLQFTLDRAYVYKPKGKPAKWVLLKYPDSDAPCDQAWIAFGGKYLPGVAKLHKKAPKADHGSGEYAIVKSTAPKRGTVYEIGWQSTVYSGTGHITKQRRLFVLQDSKGKWRFIGEGPACTSGKIGPGHAYRYTLQSKVVWTGKPEAPVRIDLMQQVLHTQLTGSDSEPTAPNRDRITYRDAVMAGKLPTKPHWSSARPYMFAKQGDTFKGIVHHLATWTIGWDTNRGNDREVILALWRKALAKLNPKLPRGKIPEGTRIRLLTYAETIKHLDK